MECESWVEHRPDPSTAFALAAGSCLRRVLPVAQQIEMAAVVDPSTSCHTLPIQIRVAKCDWSSQRVVPIVNPILLAVDRESGDSAAQCLICAS
jgi:hypothetical protein